MYVTDALQILTEHSAQSGGKYMALRYEDIITPRKEETRTADDIIQHMKNVLGGGDSE